MVQIPRYIKVEVTGCIGIFALCVDQHVCIDPHICDLLSRRQLFTPHQIGPKPSVEITRGVDSMESADSILSQRAQLRSPLQETRCKDLQVFAGYGWTRCKPFGFGASKYKQTARSLVCCKNDQNNELRRLHRRGN